MFKMTDMKAINVNSDTLVFYLMNGMPDQTRLLYST